MIPIEQALEIVLENAKPLPTEVVDFEASRGRILAEDVFSDTDLPPFARSAVDGFALRAGDVRSVPARLRLVGVVPAGTFPRFELGPGEAAHIMTGAPVPRGADAVQMVERTRTAEDSVEILESVAAGLNIARQGEEVERGAMVLSKGLRLDASSVAVAATVGKVTVEVGGKPSVAVIATGDELVHPREAPGPGRIRNSNGYSLVAQCRAAGVDVRYLGVAKDTEDSLTELIGKGLSSDILILSGGVSMGRFDLVESILERFAVSLLVDTVALKPGKPLVFGRAPESKLVFGLPGNPVSTMVTFELFVRPAMAKMEGAVRPVRSLMPARLAAPLVSRGPRRAFLPGILRRVGGQMEAQPVETRGSADIVAFARANALLVLPETTDRLEPGEWIDVYPLDAVLFR